MKIDAGAAGGPPTAVAAPPPANAGPYPTGKIDRGAAAGARTVVAAPPPAQVHGGDGCCAVPAGTPGQVKSTRMAAIAVIVTHAIALAVLGWWLIDDERYSNSILSLHACLSTAQWTASLMAIISAGVLLCVYEKGMYTYTPVLWIVAAVLDRVAAIIWMRMIWGRFYREGASVFIFPIIAMGSLIPGIVCGFQACNGWEMAPPDGTTGVPVVTAAPNRGAYASATVAQLPQQQNPPPYAGHHV